MNSWGTIPEIEVDEPDSWRGRIFLTIDIDWAPDYVIEDCLNLVTALEIPVTWFVTHGSDVLSRLHQRPQDVIGLHPNFSPLLSNDKQVGTISEIINKLRELAPNATCIRNHALVQSSPLLDEIQELGFTHECNLFLPHISNKSIKPWRHWNHITRVPHCWEDDVWVLGGCRALSDVIAHRGDGLTVLDFHPIHLFLNTSTWEQYETAKNQISESKRISRVGRNSPNIGVRDLFMSLV